MQTHSSLAFLSILSCLCPLSDLVAKQGPSYALFLVDDLGYMDIGAYNSESFYETPHADRLAKSGMKFTDGYAANPVCSPTRFGIQTGRYPTRKDATNFFSGRRGGRFDSAPLHDRMDLEEVTIAEALKKKGYATFFAGKWHLGPSEQFWPTKQGYDDNAGGFSKEGHMEARNTFPLMGIRGFRMARTASTCPTDWRARPAFIEKNKGKPFFAMLSFYSVHTPLIGRPDLVAKYKKKAAEINGAEFGDEEMTWPKNGKTRKVRILQKHAVYAAMVEAMDLAVGKVLDKLESLGLDDEVVVAFTSDNGGLSTSEGSPTSNLPLPVEKVGSTKAAYANRSSFVGPGSRKPDPFAKSP